MTRITIRLLASVLLAACALSGVGGGAAEAGVYVGQPPRQPPIDPPASALGALSVDSSNLTRGEMVSVAASGCAEDFQYVELRLVVRLHGSRVSAVVTSADAGESTFVVPTWAPTGRASIEASCLEANLSQAGDGADILRFDYAPVPVWVERTPPVERAPRLRARFDPSTNMLQVTGSPCQGRLLVSVAKGRDRVASGDRFHYGRSLITAEADGTWSASIQLQYIVDEFYDPIAPGPMTAFATCEGTQFPAETFIVPRQAQPPAVHVLSWYWGGVFVAQCSPLNTLTIVATTQGPSGTQRQTKQVPGREYGTTEVFDLPADATSVTYDARCAGRSGPAFTYESASATRS